MIISFTGKKNSGKNTAATMLRYIALGFDYQHYLEYKDKYEECWEYYTEASTFEDLPKFVYKSFASKVKNVCSIITGLPRENFDNRELRDQELGIEGLKNPILLGLYPDRINKEMQVFEKQIVSNYTYETFMQRVAEAMRDMIHQDIWVNALMQDYEPINKENRQSMGNVLDYSNCTFPNWLITDLRFNNEAQAVIDRSGYVLQIARVSSDNDVHASEQSIHPEFVFMYIKNDGTLEELYNKLSQAYKNIEHDRNRKSRVV